jgi:hypothetical protein
LPEEKIENFFEEIEKEDFYLYLIMLFTENRDLMKSITKKITDIFLKNLDDSEIIE